MPVTSCPDCGEDVLTLSGWAETDHCPNCGRALGALEPAAALKAKRRFSDAPPLAAAGRRRPRRRK